MVVATETDLVRRAQDGDRAAFGTLYETYLPKIYDFALGMLRSKADAEDVTSDTFLKAVERLGSLKEPDAFRGWLYTIARNSALNLVESRKRTVPTAEHSEAATIAYDASPMPDPSAHAEDAELRDLVWDAAATLNPRDFQVFELTVRHGMSSAEVAEVLGVRPAYAYILVNRLKGSVEEALETVLLVREGPVHCAELARLVDAYGPEVTPRMRKAVARHAKDCDACEETRKTRTSVPLLLSGMAFAAPSAAFASELASKIDQAWPPKASSGSSGSSGGRSLAGVAGVVATIVLLVTGVVGATAQRSIDRDEQVVQATQVDDVLEPSPTPTATPSESPDDEPTRTRGPVATQAPVSTPVVIIGGFTPQPTVEPTDEPVDTPAPTPRPPKRTPKPTPIRPG